MTIEQFWQLVSRTSADQDQQSLSEVLRSKLSSLSAEELTAFDKHFGQQMRRAYQWPLWGAAHVIAGCDSEYAFAEFRSFLISLGQQRFEAALLDADSLADIEVWPMVNGYAYPFVDEYDLIAGQIFEDRTGDELPFVPSGHHQPAGKKFNDKPKQLKLTYPKLSQRFPF